MNDNVKHGPRILVLFVQACILVLAVASASFAFDKNKDLARAEKALKSGDYARAEQIYRALLVKDEHDIDARLGLSKALLKQRRLQELEPMTRLLKEMGQCLRRLDWPCLSCFPDP